MLEYFRFQFNASVESTNFCLAFIMAFLSFTTPFLSLFTFVPTSNWGLNKIIISFEAKRFISFKIFKIEINETSQVTISNISSL
jgi:hypothetical protein